MLMYEKRSKKKMYIVMVITLALMFIILYNFRYKHDGLEQGQITCSHSNRYYMANGLYSKIDQVFYVNGTKQKVYLLNSNCMVIINTDYVR